MTVAIFVLTFVASCTFCCTWWYLQATVSYAFMDTCALFHLSEGMDSYLSIRRNFVDIYESDHSDEFRSREIYSSFNLHLNLLRLFPSVNKLAFSKKWNLGCYLLFLLLLLRFLLIQFDKIGLPSQEAFLYSAFFVSLLGIRARLMLIVALCLSDVINYFIFSATLLLLTQLTDSSSSLLYGVLGGLIGLGVRNRRQDFIAMFAGWCFVFWNQPGLGSLHCAYLLGFVLINLDWMWAEATKTEKTSWIRAYWENYGPVKQSQKGKSTLTPSGDLLTTIIWQRLLRAANPYAHDSLWRNLGGALVLLPLSLCLIVILSKISAILIFLLCYFILMIVVGLVMRHRWVDERGKSEQSYFSGRQMLILCPVITAINAMGFGVARVHGFQFFEFVYILVFVVILLHQVYRYLDYYLSENVCEMGIIDYPKQPGAWSVELADFVRHHPEKLVLLGDHLCYGKAFNFWQWSAEKKVVDIHSPMSDAKLIKTIKKYGVTHIVLTPFSVLLDGNNGLSFSGVEGEIRSMLSKVDTSSPNLAVYAIRSA